MYRNTIEFPQVRCARSSRSLRGPIFPNALPLLLLVASLIAREAHAQPNRDLAKNLLQQGNHLFSKGDYEEALNKYKMARATYASPKIDYNIANTLFMMGRITEAEPLFIAFLKEEETPSNIALLDGAFKKLQLIAAKLYAQQQTGGLLIKSQYPGANVWFRIDNKEELKGTTPLTLTNLAPGPYRIIIKTKMFKYSGVAIVRPAQYTTIEGEMKVLSGRVEVVSSPPEATIVIDGKNVGKTPKIVEGISAGEIDLFVQLPGYLDWRKKFSLTADNPSVRVEATLEKASYIVCQTTPAGASVIIDGKILGKTPTRIAVRPGAHEVRLTMSKMVPVSKTVTADTARDVVVAERLEITAKERLRLKAEENRRAEIAKRMAQQREYAARQQALAAQRRTMMEQQYLADTTPIIQKRRSKAIWGYTSLGVASACIAAAGLMYGLGFSNGSSAHKKYDAATDPTEIAWYRDAVEKAGTKLTVGHVLAGTGAAALGVSLYLLLSRPRLPAPPWEVGNTEVSLLRGVSLTPLGIQF